MQLSLKIIVNIILNFVIDVEMITIFNKKINYMIIYYVLFEFLEI